jgi:hypothetical protein
MIVLDEQLLSYGAQVGDEQRCPSGSEGGEPLADLGHPCLTLALHGQRRITGAHGVILMRERGTEQGHDAIAHDLVGGALVAVHRRHHALQHGIEEPPGPLRGRGRPGVP